MFSEHNERIKGAYGNYCFWSWLRYWYIDSANQVSMILIDKGYYDYDFEKIEKPKPPDDWIDTVKSDEEVNGLMAMFGFSARVGKKPETTEEIQDYLIKNIKED